MYKCVVFNVFQMLILHILLQVQLLKQQGPRVMPGNDALDAGLGK